MVTIFPDQSTELDGKHFANRTVLKSYLLNYRRRHKPCAMLVLVHKGTALFIADEITATLQETGFGSDNGH